MEQILTNILLNSLALGLVTAVLTGVVLISTRSASPMLRYRMLTALLLLFTAGVAVIGYWAFYGTTGTSSMVQDRPDSVPVFAKTPEPAEIHNFPDTGDIGNLSGYLRHFMDSNARVIALAWLLIVVIKSVRLGSSLMELHYLKTRKIFPAGRHWEEEVNRLARQTGLHKVVRIAQSGLTQVPVVIGHFRPIILIPLGMITAIKPREIEMMLLHELAHIRRMDFLVNLLQHLLEVLFFFNPAVLWLSALIRKERENCCDEMVLRQSGSKQTYIQALLSFREYQMAAPAYAMAFARESNLVTRVRRMVSQKNTCLNMAEKVGMLAAIILLCSFSLLHNTNTPNRQIPAKAGVTRNNTNTRHKQPAVLRSADAKQTVQQMKADLPAKDLRPLTDTTGKSKTIRSVEIADSSKTAVTVKLDNKVIDKLAGSLSTTLSNVVNMALDSSAHYISKSNAQQEPALKQKPQPKQKDLTTQLIEALEKSGINTSDDEFRFHIDNRELTVNGKLQPVSIHKQVISGFLKSPKDKIDFTYTRRGGYISTHSLYNKE